MNCTGQAQINADYLHLPAFNLRCQIGTLKTSDLSLLCHAFEVTVCDLKLNFREPQKDKALLSILAQIRAFIICRAIEPPI